ncbi:MAG: hypothetical protein ACTHYN_10025 [Marinobacter sp.]|uniref:hypothetical protein n=1 Tax=Marinobacter sp. TaxID=50741 RepID=UPI003F94B51E
MKQVALTMFAVLALAGCKDRVIWDDKGKAEEATEERKIWDSNGKMETGDREIWVNKEGEEVVK